MATIPGGSFVVDTADHSAMTGTADSDVFFLSHSFDNVSSGAGDDFFTLTGNHGYIDAGNGADNVFSAGHNDFLYGGAGNDVVDASNATGNDSLMGGTGNDTLMAGGAHNLLSGGTGNDYLARRHRPGHADRRQRRRYPARRQRQRAADRRARPDADGGGHRQRHDDRGTGHDTFVFNSNGGQNVVMGFGEGDILQIQHNINGLSISTAADVASHVTDNNGSAVITLGNETITLIGVKAEDIHNNPSSYFTIH